MPLGVKFIDLGGVPQSDSLGLFDLTPAAFFVGSPGHICPFSGGFKLF